MVTNGYSCGQRAKIDKFGLASYFDAVIIEGEVRFGKPDERIYRRAIETLQVMVDGVWYVGDNFEWDVAAPQVMRIWSVWND